MAKMKTKWAALCASAVAAVYSAGFIVTSEDSGQALPVIPQPPGSSAPDVLAPATGAAQAGLYKSGTFVGTGSNRRGSIQVAVTIADDKIAKVEIGDYAMHYSQSDIHGLPNEVLRAQSANVQNVSGATYSTQAFADAVQDALDQARNG